MPIPCKNPRFRTRRLKDGRLQRLTFCGNKVVESSVRPHDRNLKSGKTIKVGRHPRKVMRKNKDLNYSQLKKKFNIPPEADDDGDNVINRLDCRPWDKTRQDVFGEDLTDEEIEELREEEIEEDERQKKISERLAELEEEQMIPRSEEGLKFRKFIEELEEQEDLTEEEILKQQEEKRRFF